VEQGLALGGAATEIAGTAVGFDLADVTADGASNFFHTSVIQFTRTEASFLLAVAI